MIDVEYSRYHPITLIRRVVDALVVVLLAVIIFAVFYQVVLRYVVSRPPRWTEELARYCLVWMVLLGSSVCIRKGKHFNVDAVTGFMSNKAVFVLAIVLNLLIGMFLVYVIQYGIPVTIRGLGAVSPAMQIRMALVYAGIPIAGVAMLMETIILLVELVRQGPEKVKN